MKRASPEHDDQVKLFDWLRIKEEQIPEFKNVYANINGARVTMSQARWLKAEGMKKGVPDITMAVMKFHEEFLESDSWAWRFAQQGDSGRWYGGLYIEMKSKDNYPSPEQRDWADRLEAQGMKVVRRCVGWQTAAIHMLEYLGWEDRRMRKKFPELFVQ